MLHRLVRPVGLGVLLAGALATSVHAAPPSLDLRLGYTYDSNVSNSEASRLRQADSIFEADAVLGVRRQFGDSVGIVAKAGIETDRHAEATELSSATAMASLALVMQPTRGFAAPWFAVSSSMRWRRHRDSDIRDGRLASLALVAGQHLTDRVSAQFTLEARRRSGDVGRVFDHGQRSASLVLDYRVSNRMTTFLMVEYVDGALVTVSPRNPKLRPVFRAVSPDAVFGPGLFAWRLDGHAQALRVGWKYLLAEKTGLDASLGYSRASARGGNEWHGVRAGISLQHRFE